MKRLLFLFLLLLPLTACGDGEGTVITDFELTPP